MSSGFDSQRLSQEKIDYLTSCSIPQCSKKVFRYKVAAWHGRPLCRSHYMRNFKYGNPLGGQPTPDPGEIKKSTKARHWRNLNLWTLKFGTSFSAISAKKLGKYLRKNYVGMPYSATGPRAGYSQNLMTAAALRVWQQLGWVRLDERDGEILRFTVVTRTWNGKRMRLP